MTMRMIWKEIEPPTYDWRGGDQYGISSGIATIDMHYIYPKMCKFDGSKAKIILKMNFFTGHPAFLVL